MVIISLFTLLKKKKTAKTFDIVKQHHLFAVVLHSEGIYHG